MNSSKPASKVYVAIVHRIREMISKDGLQSGDKIPSERELSERLNVGRSSVREALRALELLGLIETRRGEGTFLRDFREHHLVELLGAFILEDKQAKQDVLLTKDWIEKDSLRCILSKKIDVHGLLSKLNQHKYNRVDDLFQQLILKCNNHLTYKIWVILKDYVAMVKGDVLITERNHPLCLGIIENLLHQNDDLVFQYYQQLKNVEE
ncbi:DNA-binding FadR family transcriptional regulator [Bacillus pakistanensis]|uniref:DNA-binding FadR family transcriptional regulator n=1 Tax=Rossellomorea pakistanensis TaxID=992288 RepID=A0ABS2NAT9_9BACI|nr:DNA-binding FadR family transcriptional regulator [Bacillus pakistanensis]